MKIRVNEEYVQEEINALELRITGKFSTNMNNNSDSIKKIHSELKNRIIELE